MFPAELNNCWTLQSGRIPRMWPLQVEPKEIQAYPDRIEIKAVCPADGCGCPIVLEFPPSSREIAAKVTFKCYRCMEVLKVFVDWKREK